MSDAEIIEIESKDQLHEAINKTGICVMLAWVEGRDAVNASAVEEFNDAAEQYSNSSKRTFAKIRGDTFKDDLKAVGLDMGAEPYPKFAIFKNGSVFKCEDVVDMDLPGEVSKARA